MAYEPGTTIDLSYLNKKPARSAASSAGNFLVSIGTSYRLRLTEAGYRAALVIPVAVA